MHNSTIAKNILIAILLIAALIVFVLHSHPGTVGINGLYAGIFIALCGATATGLALHSLWNIDHGPLAMKRERV